MPYMPSAGSLAAAHKGKIKNIRSAVLRDMKEENSGIVILKFESETLAYDDEQKKRFGLTGN